MFEIKFEKVSLIFKTADLEHQKQFIDDYYDLLKKQKDKDDNNLLHIAAKDCSLEMFEYIMSKPGADLLFNEFNSEGMNPVSTAIAHGSDLDFLIKYLTLSNVDLVFDKNGNTPIHLAAGFNPTVEFTNYILSYDGYTHALNKNGYSPLELALKNQTNSEIIEALLNFEKESVLKAALYNSSPVVLEYLLNHGYDKNMEFEGGLRPIHLVALNGNDVNLFLHLIRLGAVLNAKDDLNHTVAHFAAMNKSKNIYDYLSDDEFNLLNFRNGDLFCEDDQGNTPNFYLENQQCFRFSNIRK